MDSTALLIYKLMLLFVIYSLGLKILKYLEHRLLVIKNKKISEWSEFNDEI